MKKSFKFESNKKFLNGKSAAGLDIALPDANLALIKAVENNKPFQGDVTLVKLSANAGTGKDIEFGKDKNKVSFSASASAFAGMAVYFDPKELMEALELEEKIIPGMTVVNNQDYLYSAIRWGYNLKGGAQGAMALGAPGSVTFGGDAASEAKYAVVRRIDRNTGARTAIQETVNSWMIPSQFNHSSFDIDADFKPGTWLVAEVDGKIALNLKAQYGYDFNWIREAKLGELSGDIGLRLQLGISAALGFNASGKYALVIGRGSEDTADKNVRLMLFKQKIKGWDFAFNAGATVESDFSDFTPEKFDDFIKAVLGVNGEQIIKDLKKIEKWTNPQQDTADILVEYAKEYMKDEVGVDLEEQFNKAKEEVQAFLKKWDDIEHSVATTIWKMVEEKVDLEPVRNILQKIIEVNQDTFKGIIKKELENVNFFNTPVGKVLESFASGRILTLLSNEDAFEKVQKIAEPLKEILDGKTLEKTLGNLVEYIEKRLHLDQIKNFVENQATFDNLDKWVKERLDSVFGKLIPEKVEKIRKAIGGLLAKRQDFYESTKKALNHKYQFDFTSTYQRTTTKEALLDICFDYSEGGVSQVLQQALDGRFDDLLVNVIPGVTLNQAALSHQVKRSSHVEVNFPFLKFDLDHINNTWSKLKTVDDDEGRLLIYELESEDIVKAKNKRNSRLAIGGFFHVRGNAIRVHSTESLSYSYTLKQVKPKMGRADLQYQLKPYIDHYFPSCFDSHGNNDTPHSFVNWIGDLDKAIDEIQPGGVDNTGTDKFGNTLFSMELSLPAEIVKTWLNAPEDKNSSRYMEMSRRLQEELKRLLAISYFQDPQNYKNWKPASAMLIYCAIPASTSIELTNIRYVPELNTNKDLYWNWRAPEEFETMVYCRETAINLASMFERVYNLLKATPGMEKTASFYHPREVGTRQKGIFTDRGLFAFLEKLIRLEIDICTNARKAGLALAKYQNIAGAKPSKALKELAEFGTSITESFNHEVGGYFDGNGLLPLGTAAFMKAASAFTSGPDLRFQDPTAMLELIVLKQDASFKMSTFLDGKRPKEEDTVLGQRLVHID
ncbi:MAG: hypothetical protein GY757_52230 [bacterium]|nr:hypothetical protein [bacterium]